MRTLKGQGMTDTNAKKFMVLYLAPASVLSDWAKTDAAVRKPAEEKMQAEWKQWMADHAQMIILTEAGGKTKRVTSAGVSDINNGVMLYSVVEAQSHEAAVKAFERHPHLGIPQASIEIMEIRPMGPM
jgi:hypothetical protein